MTVKELIENLSHYDGNLEVRHINWEFYPMYDSIGSLSLISDPELINDPPETPNKIPFVGIE